MGEKQQKIWTKYNYFFNNRKKTLAYRYFFSMRGEERPLVHPRGCGKLIPVFLLYSF